MRTPGNNVLRSAVVLATLLAILSPVSATHSGTVSAVTTVSTNNVVLDVDRYIGYTFTLSAGESIVYAIQVVTGSNIDVYFFAPPGLAAYRADPPQTTQALSSLPDGQQFGGTFPATGAVTVIIDNVNGTGVAPTGQVTVQVGMTTSGGSPPPDFFSGIIAAGLLLCFGVIAIIVIVLVLIIYLATRQAAPPMPPPAPPYMPPPQQWPQQPPPQGGSPPGQWPPRSP